MAVFLLKPPSTEVFEIDFGYRFCQRWTERLWQCEIRIVSEEAREGELEIKEDV